MSGKYKNKYRIESARLKHWDYRWAGAYFITICTQDRRHYFGEIVEDKMHLSNVGVFADKFWSEIKNHSNNVELGEYVVMPNHVHGVLILNGDFGDDGIIGRDVIYNVSTDDTPVTDDTDDTPETDDTNNTPDTNNPPKPNKKSNFMKKISPKRNSVSTIIRSYKAAVTRQANRLEYPFKWQTRFHDHIIRDEKSFERISKYIINNPANWNKDKFRK